MGIKFNSKLCEPFQTELIYEIGNASYIYIYTEIHLSGAT